MSQVAIGFSYIFSTKLYVCKQQFVCSVGEPLYMMVDFVYIRYFVNASRRYWSLLSACLQISLLVFFFNSDSFHVPAFPFFLSLKTLHSICLPCVSLELFRRYFYYLHKHKRNIVSNA